MGSSLSCYVFSSVVYNNCGTLLLWYDRLTTFLLIQQTVVITQMSVGGRQELTSRVKVVASSGWWYLLVAGVNPQTVRGSSTGVFIGCSASESHDAWTADGEKVTGYEMTGCTRSMFANRLSYFFDFRGLFVMYSVVLGHIKCMRCGWVSRGLTSHSTLYRSFRGRFLQARWPNQHRQSTEGSQLAAEIGFSPTRTTPLCYNMK